MLNKIRKMLKQQEGFTLVELMIVVVILGIISGIGIQQYGKVQKKAQDAAHQANHRIIKSATQMYIMMEPSVPNEDGKITLDISEVVEKGYLEDVPTNPYTNDQDYEVAVTLDNDQYVITVTPEIED